MRMPLLRADFERGSFTKIAKALRKAWSLDDLSLMQSQDTLAILFGYHSAHDARREAQPSFPADFGSPIMKDLTTAIAKRLFLRYEIDPLAARQIASRLHLGELAVSDISAESKMMSLLRDAMSRETGAITTTDGGVARVFLDEAGYHAGRPNDSLREILRNVEDIPNAVYQVRGDKVFVFDKLVQLADALGMKASEPEFSDLSRRLIDKACVTAQDAVTHWKIVPSPYEIEAIAGGAFAIRHRPFKARLPGVYASEEAMHAALVTLLMGGIVPGPGNFEYRGQPMSAQAPFDLDGFTMAPPEVPEHNASLWLRLGRVEWRPGMPLISQELFQHAKELETAWKRACSSMEAAVDRFTASLWLDATSLGFEQLNDPRDIVDEADRDQVPGLRVAYPELEMLSDGTLWSLYDSYQFECWQLRSWDPVREDEFLFFLIGCVTDVAAGRKRSAVSVGKWVAYHWKSGNSFAEAKWFGCQVRFNSELAGDVAMRIADAMDFVEQDEKAHDLRGPKITTLGDVMRIGRKRNNLFVVTQDSSQFTKG
ncbi:hypothetical protein [Paraburkholderia sp. SIMBA_054]|uniref:hypothetical protein n=1 Tax=Paraburkholderia sp. SIMBA_054 TaxID=3085795 RepID=UPI00397BCEE4